jgi:hypothetical protein
VSVNFKAIPNGNRYPTGSMVSCLAMLFDFLGVNLSQDKIYDTYIGPNTSSDFYTRNGVQWGPSDSEFFIGDPKSTKSYGVGTTRSFWLKVFGDINRDTRIFDKYDSINLPGFDLPKETKPEIKKGNIFIAGIHTGSLNYLPSWQAIDSFGMQITVFIPTNVRIVMLYGYTDNTWLIYDPSTNKYEEVNISNTNFWILYGLSKR